MPFAFNGISLLVAIPDLTEAQASLPRDLGGRGAKEGLSAAWWGFLRGSGKRERGGGGRKDSTFLSLPSFPLSSSFPISISRPCFCFISFSPVLFSGASGADAAAHNSRTLFFAYFFLSEKK